MNIKNNKAFYIWILLLGYLIQLISFYIHLDSLMIETAYHISIQFKADRNFRYRKMETKKIERN